MGECPPAPTLAGKLSRVVAAFGGLFVALVLVVFGTTLRTQDEARFGLQAETVTSNLAIGLGSAVWNYDVQVQAQILAASRINSDIVAVAVLDPAGRLVQGTEPGVTDDDVLTVRRPIEYAGQRIGELVVHFSRQRLVWDLWVRLAGWLALIVGVFGTIVVVLVFTIRRGLRPLKALTKAIDDVAEGRPVVRAQVPWKTDDVAHVYSRFVEMAVSSQKKTADLVYAANHDATTGLVNRAGVLRLLSDVLDRPEPPEVSALFVALAGFRSVCDRFGYPTGDRIVENLAAKLTSQAGWGVLVARWADDEFLVIEELDTGEGPSVDWKTLTLGTYDVDDLRFRVQLNSGMDREPKSRVTAETLVQRAHAALIKAKAQGKGRHLSYSWEFERASRRQTEIEEGLQDAAQLGELQMVYQPQLSLDENRVVAFEALLRWNSPSLGSVSPVEFIPVAERTGLIASIGDWVLGSVFSFLRAQADRGETPVAVSVNLSPLQIMNQDFCPRVVALVRRWNIDPVWVTLEITESILLNNLDEARETLATLRKAGFKLSLDDFGTGYSSLSYLRELPFTELKIDRSFVSPITENPEARGIAQTMVALGNHLSMEVVAEGVETQAQLDLLTAWGCDRIQGYLVSPPVNQDEALGWLGSWVVAE